MIVVVMMMVMTVIVVMMVMVMRLLHHQPTFTRAKRVTELAIRHIRPRSRSPLPLNMMVMAFLNRTNLILKPEHLSPVFAQNTGRRRDRSKRRMPFTLFQCQSSTFRRRHRESLPTFQRQNLRAILAGSTIGRRHLAHKLGDPFASATRSVNP